jgi:hypothetical protein
LLDVELLERRRLPPLLPSPLLLPSVLGAVLLMQRWVEGGTHDIHVWREIHNDGRVSRNSLHLRPHKGGDLDDSEDSNEVD